MEHPAKIWMISPGQGPGRSLGVAGLVQSTAEIMGTWNITIFLKANQGTQWLHVRLCHVSHVEFPVMVIYPMLICVNGIYFRSI